MGSFNASCAVSHCSINPGDRVKLIPIVSNNPIHNSYEYHMHLGFGCYCHDMFSVIGYPMDATYEDYGNFEVIENRISQYNLSIIAENYTQNIPPAGEKSSHRDREGYNIAAEDLDWENIASMIHHGSMFLDSNADRTKRRYMGFFPVHESVYKLFLQRTPEMHFENSYDNVSFSRYLAAHIEKFKNDNDDSKLQEEINRYMAMFAPSIGTIDKNDNLVTPEIIYEKAVQMAEYAIDAHNSHHRKEYSYNNSTDLNKFTRWVRDTKQEEISDEEWEQLIEVDAEMTFLIRGLNDLQISIVPPMNAGQQYDKTDHASFLIRMGQVLLQMQHDKDDEDDYEDEAISHKTVVKAEILVSLKSLREHADSDWKPERGKLKVDAIDKFVAQYPQGVTLTANEVIEQGYGVMLVMMESTLFPLVFTNDIEQV